MTITVGIDISNPTHHVSLEDKTGAKVGLILVDGAAKANPLAFIRNPVDQSSLKTSTGNQGYSDMQPPYSPIAQDDWSGGRGNRDYEKATNRFSDSYRLRTSRANKVYLGPQEQSTKGNRSQDYYVPGNVTWVQGVYAAKFVASASYTATTLWFLLRVKPTAVGVLPADVSLTVKIYPDTAGSPGEYLHSATLPTYAGLDFTSQWVGFTISEALTSGTTYWVGVVGETDSWEIGVSTANGSNTKKVVNAAWADADNELYYRVQGADVTNTCIYFEYKKMLYKVESHTSGAPHLYRFGYRGVADSNSGHLDYLLDNAASGWVNDALISRVIRIISGPGADEAQPWRTITDNTTTKLYVDVNWETAHTTATEYVVYGIDTWNEITGHGLNYPISDVFIDSNKTEEEFVIFCMGNGADVKHFRAWNDAGTFTNSFESGDDPADKIIYAPVQKKAYKSLVDWTSIGVIKSPGDTETSGQKVISANLPLWSAAFLSGQSDTIGSAWEKINGIHLYQDDDSNEAVWVFKPDGIWIIPFKQPNITDPNPAAKGAPYQLSIANKLLNVRSDRNGSVVCRDNEYLWFNLQQGLQRYYQGHLDDMGPNTEEGLPTNRRGICVAMISYPGRLFAAFDAGSTGYSSILENDNGGWHERYRAPYGQRIKAMTVQVVPGNLSKLWVYQGNDSVWLPLPQDSTDELVQSGYLYTHEGSLEMSWMQAGMMDVIKFVRSIKLLTSNLGANCTIKVDYKIDQTNAWVEINNTFDTSPWERVDLGLTEILEGRRFKIRVRLNTNDATKTPILEAIVLNMVSRLEQKNIFSLPVRVADNDKDLNGQPDDYATAELKLAQLDAWASGETGTMLLMRSTETMYDNRLVFLPAVPVRLQVPEISESNPRNSKVYLCSLVGQDA
jgi:hypothetical protein